MTSAAHATQSARSKDLLVLCLPPGHIIAIDAAHRPAAVGAAAALAAVTAAAAEAGLAAAATASMAAALAAATVWALLRRLAAVIPAGVSLHPTGGPTNDLQRNVRSAIGTWRRLTRNVRTATQPMMTRLVQAAEVLALDPYATDARGVFTSRLHQLDRYSTDCQRQRAQALITSRGLRLDDDDDLIHPVAPDLNESEAELRTHPHRGPLGAGVHVR